MAEILKKFKNIILSYHEHDSLLENIIDEELTEEERKQAWEEYEEDKKPKPVYPPFRYGMNIGFHFSFIELLRPKNLFWNMYIETIESNLIQ